MKASVVMEAHTVTCVAKRSYCDGIRDCEDGIDEPDSCIQSTLSSLSNFLQEFKRIYGDITGSLNPKSTYGPIFGGIIGIIVLFFSLLTLVAVTMTPHVRLQQALPHLPPPPLY